MLMSRVVYRYSFTCTRRASSAVLSSTSYAGKRELSGGTRTTNNSDSKDTLGKSENTSKSVTRIKLENSKCPSAGEPQQTPAGLLFHYDSIIPPKVDDDVVGENEFDHLIPKDDDNITELVTPPESDFFIPQVKLHDGDGMKRKRVLVLCTGGTLTMAPDPERGGALSPVQGALTDFMKSMLELSNDKMPDVVVHEYKPLLDSSDMGPPDWAVLAKDIKANYLHFDGFVVLMGTDTMAYTATALSFMLENLMKPVIFTGSQIPLAEPHTDARQNLIMALIFAAREIPISEVTIFFHGKLIRACRSTKVNTGELHAFDSPNLLPLATTGISIKENEHLILPPARGVLRVHTRMDTRLLTIRLVPGFDDKILNHLIRAGAESGTLRALVLQLYGTGNAPMVKEEFIQCLKEATELGILVVASTQCHKGSVMMGHYATGRALERAGVVSTNDMTLEATACKIAYLMGRGDLSRDEIAYLMCVSMRGEAKPFRLHHFPLLISEAKGKGSTFTKYVVCHHQCLCPIICVGVVTVQLAHSSMKHKICGELSSREAKILKLPTNTRQSLLTNLKQPSSAFACLRLALPKRMKLILSLSLLLGAQAACPNQCSGHGTCGVDEVCTCYPGWGTGGDAGGDCSERFCPHELAWADAPSRGGNRHKYAECSNKGHCDREKGECACFEGYEGKACARQSCPNHCSGHGTCEYMRDLQFGIVYNEYYDGSSLALSGLGAGGKTFAQEYSWDSDRARLCVCDAGWTGLSCEERMCPYGNDVMDVIPGFDEDAILGLDGITPGLDGYGNEVGQTQTVTLYDADLDNLNFDGQTFAMKFTSKLNETFVTQPIMWDTDDATLADYIEVALEKLPNKVIDDVTVAVDSSNNLAGVVIDVAFVGHGVQGKQHKLEILTNRCDEGCTPLISGLANLRSFSDTTLSTVEISISGSHQSYECGRRGKCNRQKGICECFTGFIGDACGALTALA